MADRYTVREVRGMCLGAGGFVVQDTRAGREFPPIIWRDEAERVAARLNAEHRALSAEQDADGVTASVTPADCGKCIDPVGCTDGVCYRAWCAADERRSLGRPALPGDAELLGTAGVKEVKRG